jgi:hypothetical protein
MHQTKLGAIWDFVEEYTGAPLMWEIKEILESDLPPSNLEVALQQSLVGHRELIRLYSAKNGRDSFTSRIESQIKLLEELLIKSKETTE